MTPNRHPLRARVGVMGCMMLLAAGATGCLASPADIAEAEGPDEIASAEQALIRGSGGSQRLGYSCTNGTCTCDKSIENDCEDMTAVCTDKTVDGVITCINGWLTTHCTCTKDAGFVRPTWNGTIVNAGDLGAVSTFR